MKRLICNCEECGRVKPVDFYGDLLICADCKANELSQEVRLQNKADIEALVPEGFTLQEFVSAIEYFALSIQ